MRCFLSTLSILLVLPLAASAQDGPRGIAFVQAPENSSGMAMGRTPAEGFAAATAQCVDGGAFAEDCIPTNWCFPAGWSVVVFLMHQEGIHWHEVACGLASEDVALSVGGAMCNLDDRPYLTDCTLAQVYDPEGKPQIDY